MEKLTFRYDENNNGVWTYKGTDIYEWLYGKFTEPGGLKSFFTIGSKAKGLPFRTKELAMAQIDAQLK